MLRLSGSQSDNDDDSDLRNYARERPVKMVAERHERLNPSAIGSFLGQLDCSLCQPKNPIQCQEFRTECGEQIFSPSARNSIELKEGGAYFAFESGPSFLF